MTDGSKPKPASGLRLLVVVPAYREEKALGFTIRDLESNGPQADVVVIDDGSPDRTSQVAKSLGCQVITLPHNLGIGGAVQTGLIYAADNGYDFAVQFDADGQHVAAEMEKILSVVRDGSADVAIGSRFLSSGGFKSSFARRMGIGLFRCIISCAIGRRVTDPTSGFRAFNRDAIHFLAREYPCDYPEVEAVVFLARHGFRITEVAVEMRERQAGQSSIGALHSAYYVVKVLLAILMVVLRSPIGGSSYRGRSAEANES